MNLSVLVGAWAEGNLPSEDTRIPWKDLCVISNIPLTWGLLKWILQRPAYGKIKINKTWSLLTSFCLPPATYFHQKLSSVCLKGSWRNPGERNSDVVMFMSWTPVLCRWRPAIRTQQWLPVELQSGQWKWFQEKTDIWITVIICSFFSYLALLDKLVT